MIRNTYVDLIKNSIRDYVVNNPENHVNSHIRWDALKCYLRGCTITYSIDKRNRMVNIFKKLQKLMKVCD